MGSNGVSLEILNQEEWITAALLPLYVIWTEDKVVL